MRCSTRSGPYRCDLHEGHSGECETRQIGPDWVGGAYNKIDVDLTLAILKRTNEKRLKELRKKLAQAERLASLPYIVSPLKS